MDGKRIVVVIGLGFLLLTGCASGADAQEQIASMERQQEALQKNMESYSGTEVSLPRNLAAYLLPELAWEIGEESIKPVDFFDLEMLEKDLQLREEELASISFAEEVDGNILYNIGRYEIRLQAGDMVLISHLKVQDTTPPVITVPGASEYYVGDTIYFKRGVSVEDNSGEKLELEIDSSRVYSNRAGTYQVYYSATDSSGNKGMAVSDITICREHMVTDEEVSALAADVLDSILTEDMDQMRQAKAIFDWCYHNIRNTANANKDGILQGAYDGLYYRMGDCYTFFATAAYLLTVCGIENLDVSRAGESATHYWSLVNVGTGWYHFDCSVHIDGYQCFMQTDAQVRNYSEQYKTIGNYYEFDEIDMPSRAIEIIYENELPMKLVY